MAEHLKTKCPLIRLCKGGGNAPGLPAKRGALCCKNVPPWAAHHISYLLFLICYLKIIRL